MHTLLRLVFSWLNPRQDTANSKRPVPHALLMVLVVLIIALVAGPDLIAYIELSTLLDILGTSLFIFMFAVGMQIYVIEIRRWVDRCIITDSGAALLRVRTPRFIAFGTAHIVRNTFMVLTYLVAPICGLIAIGHELTGPAGMAKFF